MRIVFALLDQNLTPQQIGELLEDVPQATLYRHISKLVEGLVLEIVEERPVRGTVEKVYSLNKAAANFDLTDLEKVSNEDLMRYFTSFTVGLMADFARYVRYRKGAGYAENMFSFRQIPFYATPEELTELGNEMYPALLKASERLPAPDRKRLVYSSVLIPVPGNPLIQTEEGNPDESASDVLDEHSEEITREE